MYCRKNIEAMIYLRTKAWNVIKKQNCGDVFQTQGITSFCLFEIATYPGVSRHDNSSKVHQQAQKRRKLGRGRSG
ncbi:hypothetical protein Y032_0034g2908 [Ancylostoma ceylanicum]|uniref:Uncharacterized protein n=1 Tax=Ancylostoma ceylanicum TaxID=53326 RepID=A0A016ULL1_9BILA|nr:hypothetical protein Y032_0034g2908 [Ancylostoma ceylanicum]